MVEPPFRWGHFEDVVLFMHQFQLPGVPGNQGFAQGIEGIGFFACFESMSR